MSEFGQSSGLIERVGTGMTVVDADGVEVGTVEEVRSGDAEAVTSGATDPDDTGTAFPPLADAFTADSGLDPQAQARLARLGYVLVDAKGLFSGNRYVEPDQIADVSGDYVRLSVTVDQLLG